MQTEIQKTGVAYCRVSSKEQVDRTSLDTQKQSIEAYAARNNVRLLRTYIERGESAKTANRTEFNKALTFCVDRKPDYFIVNKLDRFARNQDDHVTVKAILKKAGVELRSVTEPIDETPIGRAMEGMLSVFAELDNNMRTERSKGGMLERLKQGIWVWQAPLGYYRPFTGANIAPHPETAPLVRLVFEEYSKGIYTFKSIADFINEKGLTTKSGKPMTPQLMEKMLKNPLYCGDINVWGGHQGTFESIISRPLFKKCQPDHLKSIHTAPRSANNPLFPLRKLIKCTECKVSLTGSVSTGRGGKGYPHYHHHDKVCQKRKSVPKGVFEQMFVEYLDGITPGEEYERLFKAAVLDIWKNNYKRIDQENQKIQRNIDALTQERQKIFDFHLAGKYSDEDFEEQRRLVNERITRQRYLVREKWEEEFDMEGVLEYCFAYVRDTAKAWVEADYQTKIRLQNIVFSEKLPFDGEKFGTAELARVYAINQAFVADKSSLVAPRGVEPLLPG